MARYCEYCESEVSAEVTECPNCGAPLKKAQTKPEYTETQTDEPETMSSGSVASTLAGALGASLLSGLFRPRRRPPMPPMGGHRGGPMGGHRGGPMGGRGPGGRRGGPGGPMGGPGGRR